MKCGYLVYVQYPLSLFRNEPECHAKWEFFCKSMIYLESENDHFQKQFHICNLIDRKERLSPSLSVFLFG